MIQGTTESRLIETIGYDGKYTVGANGLLEYSSARARYRIGTILYIDDFIAKTTTFYYVAQPTEEANSIASSFNSDWVKKIESFIGFTRNESSPFESIHKLSLVENSDAEEFPNNFF